MANVYSARSDSIAEFLRPYAVEHPWLSVRPSFVCYCLERSCLRSDRRGQMFL